MKKFYILILFFSISFYSKAITTASLIVLNNNIDASSLDLEVRVKGVDTVYTRINGINYLTATTMFTVPSSVLLKLTFFNAGTATPFYILDNQVFNDNAVELATLYGTSSSINFNMGTAYLGSSGSSQIKFDFLHSTSSLPEIDLITRTGTTLANDFVYGNVTFTFGNEINAVNVILDVTPYNSNANGLFAYNLNGSNLGGQYIFLFTAGTGSNLTMYMLQMNGTVTQLSPASVLVATGIINNNIAALHVFPNPVSEILFVENLFAGAYNLELTDMQGKRITSVNSDSDGQNISLDVSGLPEGLFVCVIKNAHSVYTGKVSIKH
jgi:hypothetical protein